MGIHWGVDSWSSVTFSPPPRWWSEDVRGVFAGKKLFEVVREWAHGRTPEFWGRYISPRIGSGGAEPLTREEAEFLLNRDCRIVLIYSRAGRLDMARDGRVGRNHALRAVNAAKALRAPHGVRIYLDIEPNYRPSQEFLVGWWEVMMDSPYGGLGGVYGNPRMRPISRSYCAARQTLSARRVLGRASTLYKAEELSRVFRSQNHSPHPALDRGRIPPWFAATRTHWSTVPKLERGRSGEPPPPGPITISYQPEPFPCIPENAHGSQTPAIWQYGYNVLWPEGTEKGLIDMDLANQWGYADMWSP